MNPPTTTVTAGSSPKTTQPISRAQIMLVYSKGAMMEVSACR